MYQRKEKFILKFHAIRNGKRNIYGANYCILCHSGFQVVITSSRWNKGHGMMTKMNLLNVKDCLIFWIIKILFEELKCSFFYEMLVKLWSVMVGSDDVIFIYCYCAKYNKTMVILCCSHPRFLKILFYHFMNLQAL